MDVRMDNIHHRYFLGFDFGTTYTGIAYVSSIIDPDSTRITIRDVDYLNDWPDHGDTASKVPSRIAYHGHNQETGEPNVYWGFTLTPAMQEAYSWMKLLLDNHVAPTTFDLTSDELTSAILRPGMTELPNGKSPVDVCSDFLKGVYEFAMAELARHMTDDLFENTPITFCLTVPATWSDKAKNDTREAARTAGIGSRDGDMLRLITEPEAAIIATLNNHAAKHPRNPISKDSAVILGDLGGGTNDFITYLIIDNDDKYELKELVPGQGAKSGSTFIDQALHSWMNLVFGRTFRDLPVDKIEPNSYFMREFESRKKAFGKQTEGAPKVFELPLVIPNQATTSNYDAKEYLVKFGEEEMQAFFQPSIDSILAILDAQLAASNAAISAQSSKKFKVEYVVLAGGFGSSRYIQEIVRGWCYNNGGLELLHTDDPQAAIMKGAALWGLDTVKVFSRSCRRHYGFSFQDEFDEDLDPDSKLVFQEWFPDYHLCEGRMAWQIAKGDELAEDQVITNDLELTYEPGVTPIERLQLYSSDAVEQQRYDDSEGVDLVGCMELDFSIVPLDRFAKKRAKVNGSWKDIYKIEYQVQVFMNAGEGVLKFRVVTNDRDQSVLVSEREIDYSLAR